MSKVAYLINQYPKVSHSFIRREIEGLERAGIEVVRIGIRGWDADVKDHRDIQEQKKSLYLLNQGKAKIFASVVRQLARAPGRSLRVALQALKMGLRADRPVWVFGIYFVEACILFDLMKQNGVRHVHAHFGTNGTTVAMLAARLQPISYSFTVHGPEEFDKPEFIHLGDKIRGAAFVAAITSYCRSQLYRWVGVEQWPKIEEVHCGLEPEFHAGHVSPPPSNHQLVCIGRLCEQKGQLLLVQAAAQLAKTRRDFKIILAGDGELRAPIEALIQQHKLQDLVTITGWISSEVVRELLVASRAMVLPSFAEGLPVVVMEALSLQRPVITTSIAGIPELVENQQTGWLIKPGSIDDLVRAMNEALDTPQATLLRYGEVGRARVLERHDIDTEATRLATLFQRALNSPAAGTPW